MVFKTSPQDGKPLVAGPAGGFVMSGDGAQAAAGGETFPSLWLGNAEKAAPCLPNDDADPWSDANLGLFFLGSLGMNVSSSSIDKIAAQHPCGPDAGWFVSRETKRQWPARCKKLTCAHCLPREAAIRQAVLAESMPDSVWSQTMVAPADSPDPWQAVRYKMNLFFGFYRRKAPLREISYVVEMNPQRTGYHVHALCHGPKWKISILKDAQRAAGLGLFGNHVVSIGAVHEAAGYGLKGFQAAGYGLKGFSHEEAAREALRINGGRLEHHTRGFIRVNGKPCTLAAARKAFMKKKYGEMTSGVVFMRSPVATWFFERSGEVTKGKAQTILDDL
jgi:hypothetical protein